MEADTLMPVVKTKTQKVKATKRRYFPVRRKKAKGVYFAPKNGNKAGRPPSACSRCKMLKIFCDRSGRGHACARYVLRWTN
jgi:hypothetical protein